MTASTALAPSTAPNIIQGGMGIGVSSWRLARRVARRGEIGVISGTGIDSVVVRELQEGDPHDRRRMLAEYPDDEIAGHLIDRFYRPEGMPPGESYDLLNMQGFEPSIRAQRILAAATYTEVRLAAEGHEGTVGMNLLAKLKRYTLPCIYGALLAGVDIVSIGAGIPLEEARQIPKLAAGEPAALRLDVDTSQAPDGEDTADDTYVYRFDPADVLGPAPPTLDRPLFLPIISSDALARIMDAKLPDERVDGWVVEGPVAGGHNAPPRNKNYTEDGTPLYDERDEADLEAIRSLGKPFYLAGGYGSPEGLRAAHEAGAAGIQVGSLFSLADESGYPPSTTRRLIRGLHNGEIEVSTDGRASSTGFPFKVLTADGTLADAEVRERRARICDLGYLREPYLDEEGRLMGRCPAEPVKTYTSRGGDREETEGRACLCNALMANIGLGQQRGTRAEPPLFTGGDALEDLPLGSAEDPQYDADDVLNYLYEDVRPPRVSSPLRRPQPAD
ncbi:nitronate monooxygenase [Salinibacter grassmerensis]|uniref:nitronate monooxygenase n=1 Tax=Salinibacter grassmerensis TaxID=3040353 RepID=UPI0021E87253|nr:nitronate monooxygenase [Salinibacter grassmerensis]